MLQERLDYGFNGYQVPPMPRAARSARKRCFVKKNTEDRKMCPFDLLATVAGKMLLDGESCPPSSNVSCGKDHAATGEDLNREEAKGENKPLEEKSHLYCYERNFLITELVSEAPNSNYSSKELASTQNDVISMPDSVITTYDCSEKVGSAEQLANDDCRLSLGISPPVDVDSSRFKKLSANKGFEDEKRTQIKLDSGNNRNFKGDSKASLYSSWHSEPWNKTPSMSVVSSVNSLKFPSGKDHTSCAFSRISQDNVKLVNRDDDENSPQCIKPCTSNKVFKPQKQAGDCRFRKFLAPKHCNTAPNPKDVEHCNGDMEKDNYLNKSFKCQRSLQDYPFKKRKLYSFMSNSEEGISSDGTCRARENGIIVGELGAGRTVPGVISPPTSAASTHASLHPQNARVKLKIKSFRIPELFIEIPETATVGSLKKTVMEAASALLRGGLHVGVLLHGKKIRDDTKTLFQTGISHENKVDSLGFTLEPSSTAAPVQQDRPDKVLCENPQPLARYPPTPRITKITCHQGNLETPPSLPGASLNNFTESDHDSAPSPRGLSSQGTSSESKALVTVPSTKPDSLAVVPLRKFKRSESAQRRIRRPFTVAEVEALVQAVEKLGTGRWRDVKLRAFDSAKHRTYVDLKDKWKTLVHTARISPQQRRGEPVPQELLDRVLTAHAYWSQQQAKQQLKSAHQPGSASACFL